MTCQIIISSPGIKFVHFYMCIRTNQHLDSRGLPIVIVPEAVTDLTELEEID